MEDIYVYIALVVESTLACQGVPMRQREKGLGEEMEGIF